MEGEKIHILILPSLPYQTEYLPFAGIFQRHQAEALAGAGHRVGVLSAGLLPFAGVLRPNRYGEPAFACEAGVTAVRRFQRAFLPQRFIGAEAKAAAMLRLGGEAFRAYAARCGAPDLLHVHDCLYAGLLARKLKAECGLPYMVTEHSTMHQRGLYGAAQREMIRSVLREASAVTAVGSGLKERLQASYGDIGAVQHLEIVYNLLDRAFESEPLPPPRGRTRDGGFVFLSVGHLVEQKSQVNLIAAMPDVLRAHPGARLWIGGEGPMRPRLEREIARLGLGGSVKLLGALDREQVKARMRQCDAFVLSSRVETFGVVLIEAMALGKPVIATASGGPEDFVDGASGRLIPPDDVPALAGAMTAMAGDCGSYDAAAIRERCIARFGSAAFVARMEGIYRGVLAGRSGNEGAMTVEG